MVTIMLKKTHNGTQQKQRHNRLWRETRGFGIGFPFDRKRKQRREGGRAAEGRNSGKEMLMTHSSNKWHNCSKFNSNQQQWGHSGQDLLYWQQHAVSLPAICVLMYRQALSQHGRCLDSTFKSHDLSEGCAGADVFPIQHGQLKFTLCISHHPWVLLTVAQL